MTANNAPMAQRGKSTSNNRPWLRALGRIVSGALVLAALVVGWFIYRVHYANPRTDDAYVHANTAALAAHVSGQIVQLPIKDNQHVNEGELLFVVDPRPYKLALDSAQTQMNLTEVEIKTLHDAIGAATAQLAARRVEEANVKQYLDRIVPLRDRDFVTENEVVDARNKLKAAQASVAAANSDLQKAQDGLGVLGNVNQRIRAAQDAVDDAQLNYNYCFVKAPFDGYVTNLSNAHSSNRSRSIGVEDALL
jgi:multidrug resistance efflux pump